MLIDIDKGNDRRIETVPFARDFDLLRGRLLEGEFAAMVDRVNELIEEAGGEIATAGWLPGSDWTGTVFAPIYDKAARGDFDRSAMFFGQLVWYTIMRRPEKWASGRYQVDGRDIGSRTYFRLGS
jgi:hypothetical protein